MEFTKASTIAGTLYGNILLRDADQDGYNDAVYKLTNRVDPLSIAEQMMMSEEFVRKFLVNRPAIDIVKKLTVVLCGWELNDEDALTASKNLYLLGYKLFVKDLILKARTNFGNNFVPSFHGEFS